MNYSTLDYDYKGNVPSTSTITDSFLKTASSSATSADYTYAYAYYQSGAPALQNLVDSFILNKAGSSCHMAPFRYGRLVSTSCVVSNLDPCLQTTGNEVTLTSYYADYPSPAYTSDSFWSTMSSYFGLLEVCATHGEP